MDHEGHPYTQQHLAQILGITDQAVRDLENKDAGMDFDRRQFLSKLLAIPPILLGVITLDEIRRIGEERGIALTLEPSERVFVSGSVVTGRQLTSDPKEYRKQLNSYWQIDYSRDAYGTLADTLRRTSAMYQELPYVKPKERYQLHELLCSYHQFIAYLLRDKQMYDGAIIHANKACQMAELLSDDEQKALALYSRGYIFWSANRMNFALIDFENARKYDRNLPGYLNGPIHLFSGLVKSIDAKTKKDQRGQKDALLLLDRGGNIVRKERNRENPHFIDFSLKRYHGVKSLALMAIGENREAINELKLISRYGNVRGQVYYDISLAQARASLGDYSEAARLAVSTLPIVQEINSEINITRIENLFQRLQKSPYKDSPDVGHLDYLLHYKHRAR
jgi:tetratricopeptide (TPR) repeat protein